MKKLFSLFTLLISLNFFAQEAVANPNDVEYAPQKSLRGRFSINAAGEQIVFAQGNLQVHPLAGTHVSPTDPAAYGVYQFAATQWERCNTSGYSPTYEGWIDVHGWGTGDAPGKNSGNTLDYITYHEWGANAIHNGGDSLYGWRTLTADEWQYIIEGRPNADKRAAFALVNNVQGYMLLPDNWQLPVGLTFYPGKKPNEYGRNTYTLEQWQRLEDAGAVFLPNGYFWSSTPQNLSGTGDENRAYAVYNYPYYSISPRQDMSICNALQVRLVQTPTLPDPEVAPTYAAEKPLTAKFRVSEDKVVVFSQGYLQYNDYLHAWQFAENQWDYLSKEQNISVSDGYAEWIDLFAWGTGNNPILLDPDIHAYVNFTDWGINPIHNGGNQPNQWFTLSREEWMYLFQNQDNMIATVHGNKGRIVLPPTFKDQPEYLDFSPQSENANVLTDEQWAELEAKGAVFFPAGLDRYLDDEIDFMVTIATAPYIRVWSSTPYADEYSPIQYYAFQFFTEFNNNGSPWSVGTGYRSNGMSVRLVQETINTIPLDLAIIDAHDVYNRLLDMAEKESHPGYAELAAQLLIAIESAEAVANDPDATLEEITNAKERLENYIGHLDYAASVWMIYYDFFENGYTEIAETFKAATDAAVATLLSEDATEEEIANAIKTIEDAYDAAYYAYQHWDVENVAADKKPQKLLRNNMLLILNNGKTFNALGVELK